MSPFTPALLLFTNATIIIITIVVVKVRAVLGNEGNEMNPQS